MNGRSKRELERKSQKYSEDEKEVDKMRRERAKQK